LIASTAITVKGLTEKVSPRFPKEYVEAYASRAGFFLPRDKKILQAHDVYALLFL
jgi:hypothetical protein